MIIYKTTNLVNNKIYVGKDSYNNHLYLGSGIKLKQSIKKHGRKNFRKEILQYCDTEEELNEAEIFWIKELNSQDENIGYNIAFGGNGAGKHSEESKKKMSISQTGKKQSDETRLKKSLAGKGRKISEETKLKISLNRKMSENSKKKLSEERMGNKNPMYNKKPWNLGLKNHFTPKNKKIVLQYSLNDEFIKEWESVSLPSKELNISRHISDCCNGKRETCGGFKWKWKNSTSL